MANAVPLLEGTSTSGGTLLPPTPYGQTLVNGLLRRSAALSLARVNRVNTNAEKFSVYAGRPTAAFVAEAAAKGVTGAEYTELTVNIKKIATIVMYTQELIDDAREDPTVLVNADVVSAFDYLIDAHMLGYSAGSSITTSFDGALRATTSTVEYVQANADGLATAISTAMGTVEANGYTPTGVILPNDAKLIMRNARDTTTQPLYLNSWQSREPNGLFGLDFAYSTNLPTLAGTAAAGRVVGIVGDFNHALAAIRQDMQVDFSNQATVDVSGTLHHLWQQNKLAARWEMRLGFNTHDVNNAFCAIINAA